MWLLVLARGWLALHCDGWSEDWAGTVTLTPASSHRQLTTFTRLHSTDLAESTGFSRVHRFYRSQPYFTGFTSFTVHTGLSMKKNG